MRWRKLCAVLTALAMALGLAALSTESATAMPKYATRTKLQGPGSGAYGFSNYACGSTTAPSASTRDDRLPSAGSYHLQRRWPGHSVWTTVGDRGWPADEWQHTGECILTAHRDNADYRLYYTGGVDDVGQVAYAPSYSNVVHSRTRWAPTLHVHQGHRPYFRGKVGPRKRHLSIKVQVKSRHHSWRHYKTVCTNKHGQFHAGVRNSGLHAKYRVVVPGTALYTTKKTVGYAFKAGLPNF